MVQVYTYPERKEIFADNEEELLEKAEALKEDNFWPMSDWHKSMGTYRQTFLKMANTDPALFPSEEVADEG